MAYVCNIPSRPRFSLANRKRRVVVCAPVRGVFDRLCPGMDYLFRKPVFALEFSKVVAGLGVGVVLGLFHEIASNV